MPTYVYECKKCAQTLEVEQRITEAPLTDCECGAAGSLRRVVQPVGIAFKGSGFYVTDSSPAPTSAAPCGDACACAPEKAATD
jgi:putative FmdB family regulatory protein